MVKKHTLLTWYIMLKKHACTLWLVLWLFLLVALSNLNWHGISCLRNMLVSGFREMSGIWCYCWRSFIKKRDCGLSKCHYGFFPPPFKPSYFKYYFMGQFYTCKKLQQNIHSTHDISEISSLPTEIFVTESKIGKRKKWFILLTFQR